MSTRGASRSQAGTTAGGRRDVDPATIRRALARAATLAERSGRRGTDARPGPAGPDAMSRLARWRAQEPFDKDRWWHARLDADGLTEQDLLALITESPEELARRLGEPAWLRDVTDALLDDLPGSVSDDDVASENLPFLAVAAPLLAPARARLLARLRAVDQPPAEPVFDPEALLGQFLASLYGQVHRAVERALILEVNLARQRGELPGATSEQRFAAFVRQLREPARQRALLCKYPVLARQIAVTATQWEQVCATLAERLAADAPHISATFADGRPLGLVEEVTCGLGDRHRGGASVMSVRWSGGLRLIYKPRPVDVDVHFQNLLGWLNEQGVTTPFRRLTYLSRGDYGWAEFVTARPCADEAARRRFYRRQGGLLAVLHVLRATDFHAENIIAADDQPVLVDLESLLDPGFPDDDAGLTAAERLAGEASRSSVLGVGLLPARIWVLQPGDGADLSGLGHTPGAYSPLARPTVRQPGTDRIHVRLERTRLGGSDHRPVGPNEPLRLLDYTDDILAGFTEVYRICQHRRDELSAPNGPLAAFAGDEVRVILRPTMWYGVLLQAAHHPDLLQDGLDRERHFDLLWRQAAQQPLLTRVIPYERGDLHDGDVPVFTARTDQPTLYDSRRRPVPGVTLVPGLDRARQRLAELSDSDLTQQRWLIRGSLGTAAVEAGGEMVFPSYQAVAADAPLDTDRLLAVADTVGFRLSQIAMQADDSAQWLGVVTVEGKSWAMGALQPDLFHGLTGIALFLGWLGQLTGDRSRSRLARRALVTALHQLDRGVLAGTNGFAGLPGAVYAVAQLARLWGDEPLLDLAEGFLDQQLGTAVDEDEEYDFTSGVAGTLAVARTLHRIRPADRHLDTVRRCADRLVATARHHPIGVGWLPRMLAHRAERPIAGFAHGVASIAWTLFEAAELLGDDRYGTTAREAVAYEQTLFQPERGTWADLRDYRTLGVADSEQAQTPVAWCYGAMGVGLARLLCLPHLRDDPVCRQEISAALETTRRLGFGVCHALCHGDVGNTELFLHAAATLGEPRWQAEARLRLASVVASAARQGWVCGTPLGVQTPGLMVGLAGAGYGMLRAARPDVVPAVLALQP